MSTLYYINGCPGARAVRLYCRKINQDIKEVLVDFKKGDHMTKKFLKLNPMHTVPTLELKNGKGIYESRLILKHLAGLYKSKTKSTGKMEIDHWLFWDLGFLNTNVGKVIYPRLFMNSEPVQKDIDRLVEKLEHLNKHLENNTFLVDNSFSIADLSSAMLVHNSQIRKDLVDITSYPNITKWLDNVEKEFTPEQWNEVMDPFKKWVNEL